MDLAQRAFHEHHKCKYGSKHHDHTDHEHPVAGLLSGRQELRRSGRKFSDNTDKNDQRDTVADAAAGDLFTHPHQEHGAANDGDHRRCAEEQTRIVSHIARF